MYDGGKIMTGLVIFIAVIAFPFWYTAASGKGDVRPNPQIKDGEENCVASKEFMKTSHMNMLNEWRDSVVREGNRVYTAEDGKKYNMSLSATCMDCHDDQTKFCDECHNYVGVSPYCWDCHIEPKGE